MNARPGSQRRLKADTQRSSTAPEAKAAPGRRSSKAGTLRSLFVMALTAFVASCTGGKAPSGRTQAVGTASEALQTDLTLTETTSQGINSLTATLPVVQQVGSITQSIEGDWDNTLEQMSGPPIYPQGWTLSYFAGASQLSSAPTTQAQWSSVTRVLTTGTMLSGGLNGTNQQLTASVSAPVAVVAAAFSGSSNGDGWDVFFDPNHTRVFEIHHHDSPAAVMCYNLVNSSVCSGSWPVSLTQTSTRATGYIDPTSMYLWQPTVTGSSQLAWDCVVVANGTRCPTPTVVSQYNAQNTAYDNHIDHTIIGRKFYSIGFLNGSSRITCLDMSTGTECAGVQLTSAGNSTNSGIDSNGNLIYAYDGASGKLECYDSTTWGKCPGWPVSTVGTGRVHVAPSADGSINNVCADFDCFALNGGATTLPPNYIAYAKNNREGALGTNYPQYANYAGAGNQVAWSADSSVLQCWNMANDAPCSSAFANGGIHVNTNLYTAKFDPIDTNCLWTNSDDGQIRNYRIDTGAQGCAGGAPRISFAASLAIPQLGCSAASRIYSYNTFQMTSPSTAAGQYTSATLTVYNSNGVPIPGWTNLTLAANGSYNLSGLTTAVTGQTPLFNVAATGFTNLSIVPAATLNVVSASTPQLCFNLGAPYAACPTTAGLAVAQTGTTATTITAKGSLVAPSGDGGTITTNYTNQTFPTTSGTAAPSVPACGGTINGSVRDSSGNPLAGVPIALLNSSGQPVLSNGVPVTTTTASDGTYSFLVWGGIGYKVSATATNSVNLTSSTIQAGGTGTTSVSSGTVTSNVVTPPDAGTGTVSFLGSVNVLTLSIVSGTPQTDTINSAFGAPLLVKVVGSSGSPIANELVTFTVPGTGASAVLSSATATTGVAGTTSVNAIANGISGTYTVSASIGVGSPVTFTLTNAPNPGGTVPAPGTRTDICYPGGATMPNFLLNGNAKLDGTGLELTPSLGNQLSSGFFTEPLSSARNLKAHLEFTISLDVAGGAEGLAFIMEGGGVTGPTRELGGLLSPGYLGISPSVAVEFDTLQESGDPDSNHVAINKGGVSDHTQAINSGLPVLSMTGYPSAANGINLKGGYPIDVWIEYTAATTTLNVYIAKTTTKPATPALTTTAINLASYLGSTFYVGLTSATGTAWSQHEINSFLASDTGNAGDACCNSDADCEHLPGSALGPFCDLDKHVCGPCNSTNNSQCGTDTPVCATWTASSDTCVAACNGNVGSGASNACVNPGAPVCSTSGPTVGTCVTCSGNYAGADSGASTTYNCPVGAPTCRADGYCGFAEANGAACNGPLDCAGGACINGLCATSSCGDGYVNGTEQCDDGNVISGDGCSATCQVEAGFTCTNYPAPSFPDGNFDTTVSGFNCSGQAIAGWTIDQGNVDLINPGTPQSASCTNAATGSFACQEGGCIDLSGNTNGSLYHDVATIPGHLYEVVARAAANSPTYVSPGKLAYLSLGDTSNDVFQVQPFYGRIPTQVPQNEGKFEAENFGSFGAVGTTTRVRFIGTDPSSAGCFLDNVRVFDTTPGAAGAVGSLCTPSACGNGVLNAGEECDDGNTASGDGCSSDCLIEVGATCAGTPSVCKFTCGDGVVDPGEQCDDGNTASGDGCSSTCLVEPGYSCKIVGLLSTKSTCTKAVCGNGVTEPPVEQCDDGASNGTAGDPCGPTCLLVGCGNGYVDPGEACDDGIANGTDGKCSKGCQLLAGQLCTAASQCAAGSCGANGVCGLPNGSGPCTSATASAVCQGGACTNGLCTSPCPAGNECYFMPPMAPPDIEYPATTWQGDMVVQLGGPAATGIYQIGTNPSLPVNIPALGYDQDVKPISWCATGMSVGGTACTAATTSLGGFASAYGVAEQRGLFVQSTSTILSIDHRLNNGWQTSSTGLPWTLSLGQRFRLGGFDVNGADTSDNDGEGSDFVSVYAPTGATVTFSVPVPSAVTVNGAAVPATPLPFWTTLAGTDGGRATSCTILNTQSGASCVSATNPLASATSTTVTLTANQTYVLHTLGQGSNASTQPSVEIDGALVTSDQPIAVVTGGRGWIQPFIGSGNQGADSVVPTSLTGKTFVLDMYTSAPPTSTATGYKDVRVVADQNNTVVSVWSAGSTTLNGQVAVLAAGQVYSFTPTALTTVVTSNPAYVYQNAGLTGPSGTFANVELAMVPPIAFASSVTTQTVAFNIMSNSVAARAVVVLPTTAASSVTMDGVAIPAAAITSNTAPEFPQYTRLQINMAALSTAFATGEHHVSANSDFQLAVAQTSGGQSLFGYYSPYRVPNCGNGILDPGESCDDGNVVDNDGCSVACKIQEGFLCAGVPSACSCRTDAACGTGTFCNDATPSQCQAGLANGTTIPAGHGTCGGAAGVKGAATAACASGFCSASNECVPTSTSCALDSDCASGKFCSRATFTCTTKLANGAAIPNDVVHNGVCNSTTASEVCASGACNATTNSCSGPAGTACPDGPQDCTSDVCASNAKCGYTNGSGPCTSATAYNCQSGFCSTSGECIPSATGCFADTDCTASQFCNRTTFVCTTKLGSGIAIPNDGLHTGTCTPTNATAVCASAACNTATNTCSVANGITCAAHGAADCTSNECGNNSLCGLNNGQTGCTSTTTSLCQSGTCSTAGACEPSGGCWVDADCASGNYCNRSSFACTPKLAAGTSIPSDGLHDGTCATATATNAVEVCQSGECNTTSATCAGSNSAACTNGNQCVTNLCGTNSKCGLANGQSPCTTATAANCQSGSCSATGVCVAIGGCYNDGDCTSAQYCNRGTATCTTKLTAGTAIPNDTLHNGTCTPANASATCQSAACNATTNTCATASGTSCTNANQCVVNECLGTAGSLLCGYPSGQGTCTAGTASVCQSLKCSASGECVPNSSSCWADSDCTSSQYCNRGTFTCTAKGGAGVAIPNDTLHNGTCTPASASATCSTNACNATTNTCSTANGTACTNANQCTTNSCGTNGQCGLANGQSGCSATTTSLCQSNTCSSSGTCEPSGGCYVDADCTSSQFCLRTSFTCTTKLAAGTVISNDGLHNGTCTPANATAVCAVPLCNATTNTCATANNTACTSAKQCVANACAANGECGIQNGQTGCTSATASLCQSGVCDASGACIPSGGCYADADCASGTYCNRSTLACTATLGAGVAIPNDGLHNGTCTTANEAVCSTGACNTTTNTCSAANGAACKTASQCTTNYCGNNSQCGLASGQAGCTSATAAICQSDACSASGTCVPSTSSCYIDTDCPSTQFCARSSFTCTNKLAAGQSIPNDGLHNATCTTTIAEEVCTTGACNVPRATCSTANGTVCTIASDCTTNNCGSNSKCGLANGDFGCTSATASSCQSGLCGSSGNCIPAGGCYVDADCTSGNYCDRATLACTPKLGAGVAIPNDGLHTGTCTTTNATEVCTSGVCNTTTNTCASVSGTTCTAASQCVVNECLGTVGSLRCGYPNGQGACTSATASICQSLTCSPSGTCVPATGGCEIDSDCSSSNYCNRSTFTCVPKLVKGTAIPNDGLHNGTCTTVNGLAVCADGGCNTTSNTCAAPNSSTCTNVNQCVTNICDGGSCGYQVGHGPCTQGVGAAVCQSDACSSSSGKCVATNGGCTVDADCSSVQYCNILVNSGSGVCASLVGAGLPVPTDGIHNGTCSSSRACVGGLCNTTTNTCAQASNTACTNVNQCTTDQCINGLCGYPNGQGACTAATANICQSGVCSPSGTCIPSNGCYIDSDCSSSTYCNRATLACVPKLPLGAPIAHDGLHTGTCVDAAHTCVSGLCDLQANTCGAVTGTACTNANQCVVNACGNGICGYANGTGTCTTGNATACQSGVCSSGGTCVPLGGCAVDADCTSTQFCSFATLSCRNKLGAGVSIPLDGLHDGKCDAAAAVCVSGLCNPVSKSCAVANGGACIVALQCTTDVCGSNGMCGLANGQSGCTASTAVLCQSGVCDASGTCIPSGGGGCYVDADCNPNQAPSAPPTAYCQQSTLTCASLLAAGKPIPKDGLHDGACDAAPVVCASGLCDATTITCANANGVACTKANQCVANVCGNNGTCGLANGQTSCTFAAECQSDNCAPTSGICLTTGAACGTDADCSAGQFCNPASGACVSQLVAGVAIPVDSLHDGKCDAAPAVCVTGLCDSTTSTCANATGQPCGAANQCVDNVCSGGVGALCGNANGQGPCTVATQAVDCQSGFCSATGVCIPNAAGTCWLDSDCQSYQYCAQSTFTCVPKLYPGTAIPSDGLHGGTCASAAAVCTTGLCNTTTSTCASANNASCAGASACVANACSNNLCGLANGQGSCTTESAATVCQSGVCSGTALVCVAAGGGGCFVDSDCAAGKYCNQATFQCVAQLSAGSPVPNDGLHTGVCVGGVNAACVGGQCSVAAGTCGSPNGSACTAANQCQSGACGSNGKCGLADGQSGCTALTGPVLCQSGGCTAEGACSPPGGCVVDADCVKGLYCNETAHLCAPLLINGTAVPSDGLHNGTCSSAAATCVSGLCNATAVTCGGANGVGCSSAAGCVANACGSNGLCGLAIGDSGCATLGGASACQSGVCSTAGNRCLPTGSGACGADSDCPGSADYCNAVTLQCVPKLASGSPLPNDPVHNGACTPALAAAVCVTGLCNVTSETCAGNAGAACQTAAACVIDVCGAGNKCGYANGAGPCTVATASGNCQSGACSPGGDICIPSAAGSCYVDSDCSANMFCNRTSFTCVSKLASGTAIPTDGLHDGTCTLASGQQVCTSGSCNEEQGTCADVNGHACTSTAECVVNVCVQGTCGAPDAAVCSSNAMCLSQSCLSGTCQSSGSAPSLGGGGATCTAGPVGDDVPFGLAGALVVLGLVAARARRRRHEVARP